MPDKGKKPTSASGSKGRASSSSHSGISNSGRNMPPTTRSMQGRLPGTSQASSPQAQAGPSRGTAQQGTSQRTTTAAVTKGSHPESSDEDDDDDDDDSEDDEEDSDGDGDNDASNNSRNEASGYSDDEDDDVRSKVLKIFATAEPNGLTRSEIDSPDVIQNQEYPEPSTRYRALVEVVIQQAIDSPAFYNKLTDHMDVPGNDWSMRMCYQLRTRFHNMIVKFDASASGPVRHHTVINTAKHLGDLVTAIKSLTKPTNWQQMGTVTRLQYFGLVLEVLLNVVARDNDSRSARSSPYAVETLRDHNLYLQMVGTGKCAHTMFLLHGLFNRLRTGISQNQLDNIRTLLRDVEGKHDRYGNTLPHSGDFVNRLRGLAAAAVPRPRRS